MVCARRRRTRQQRPSRRLRRRGLNRADLCGVMHLRVRTRILAYVINSLAVTVAIFSVDEIDHRVVLAETACRRASPLSMVGARGSRRCGEINGS